MTVAADVDVRISATPVWLRLVDTHTRRRPRDVDVRLERRVGASDWVRLDVPHQISTHVDLGFLGLGRGRVGTAGSFDVRVTLSAPGTVVDAGGGAERWEGTVDTWTDQAPPTPTAQTVRFFPAPDYGFGAGTPLLAGRVVDATGAPVDRAEVRAVETVGATTLVEEVRTRPDGWFRLPLRWSAGSTQVVAALGGLSGSTTIVVPDGLASQPTITLT
jgi:Carboxypeptidase regulatory-like domain